MKLKAIAFLAVPALMMAGCDTYTAQQYQSSAQNTITLQELAARGERATVGEVRLAEGVEPRPTCRLAGPLDLGGGDNVAQTIKEAMQAELLAGGVYRPGARPVNIIVTGLQPDSFKGEWKIGLQAYTQQSSGFAIQSTTPFSTSFSAYAACNNTATAFNRALASAIQTLVSDPRFAQML
ncbi:hypothetical protein [Salipiger marinus]|uniref:hypothetical protein n=1 Tax=Salipiger marinus TaxID=555512 RepID=UPI0010427762|nr:hypothetical protein [Salipiger marinus]